MALKPRTDSLQVCLLHDLNIISIDKRSCHQALSFNRSPMQQLVHVQPFHSHCLCCLTLTLSYGQDVYCLVKRFLSVPPSNAVKNVPSCQKHFSIHYVLEYNDLSNSYILYTSYTEICLVMFVLKPSAYTFLSCHFAVKFL